jgi:adenosine deaminase
MLSLTGSSTQQGATRVLLTDFIQAIPKIELHVHLEGSIQPRTLLALAQRNGVALPAGDEAALREQYRFTDFAHFVRTYLLISSTLQRAEDFALIVADFATEMARQHIRYAEVTFTPMTHVNRGVPWEALRDGLDAGRVAARSDHGVEIAWIFDIVRSLPETAEPACDLAIAGQAHGVVALGLGGPEAGWPPEPYAAVFARARAAGLHAVPHAGEAAGPESVWGALRALGAERIGHGVRSAEDPELLDTLRERQIPLEISPTSNLCLGVYRDLAEHPICRFWREGLYVTVNSDDPPLFGTDLNREVELVAGACGLDADGVEHLSLKALHASFLAAERKAALDREFRLEFARLRAA